jgi:hypothetical protein
MREVEIRVRDLAGASSGDLGVRLIQESFKVGGKLADSSLESGEQQATMALFWGAIGVFKSPSSHRQVEYDDRPPRAKWSCSPTCFCGCSTGSYTAAAPQLVRAALSGGTAPLTPTERALTHRQRAASRSREITPISVGAQDTSANRAGKLQP